MSQGHRIDQNDIRLDQNVIRSQAPIQGSKPALSYEDREVNENNQFAIHGKWGIVRLIYAQTLAQTRP